MRIIGWLSEHEDKLQRLADALAEAGSGPDEIRTKLEAWIDRRVSVLADRADEAVDWTKIAPGKIGEWLEERDGRIIEATLDLLVDAALSSAERRYRAAGVTRAAARLRISGPVLRPRIAVSAADAPTRIRKPAMVEVQS